MGSGSVCCLISVIVVVAIVVWIYYRKTAEERMRRNIILGRDPYKRKYDESQNEHVHSIRFKPVRISKGYDHEIYGINGDGVCACNKSYAQREGPLPQAGVIITPREYLNEVIYYIKTYHYPLSKIELREIYEKWKIHNKYDLMVVRENNKEYACGDRECISWTYSVDHSGVLFKESKYFIRLFDYDCSFLGDKFALINFVEININKNEVGEIYKRDDKLIVFGKGKLVKTFTGLEKEMLGVFYGHQNFGKLYLMSYHPVSKRKLSELVRKMEPNPPDGVITEHQDLLISAVHRNLLTDLPEIEWDYFLVIFNKVTGSRQIHSIDWQDWNSKTLLQAARKFL